MIVEKVNQLYQTKDDASTSSICPGEDDCQIFEAAFGETHAEKCQNACFGCPMESTKPQSERALVGDAESESIIAYVEQVRQQRDSSGDKIDMTTIDAKTWRLVMIYDEVVEANERNLRLYARALFEALSRKV